MSDDGLRIERGQTNVRHKLALILLITLLVAYIDRTNVAVLVVDKSFLVSMGIANDPVAKGALMTVFLICFGIGSVILSPVGDWLGPRKTMIISIWIWTAALIWGGFANDFVSLLFSRAALGIGEAMHFPMLSKFVKNWFPVSERGKANAIWLIGVNVAPMIAMPLFAWMVPAFGWRTNFFFLAVLGLLPILLLWKYTADHPHLYKGIGKAELSYIEIELRQEKEAEVGLANNSMRSNIVSIIRDYRVWLLVLAYSGTSSIWWGTVTWLPAYLKEARGFSWAAMGAWASLPYALAIMVKIVAGYAVDKWRRPAQFYAVGLLGSAIFIYLSAYAESGIAATILISCGIGTLALGTPCAWLLLQQILPSKVVGTGSGLMSGVSSGISATVPMIVGLFITITGSYVGGLMFIVGWGIFSGAVCMVLVLVKIERSIV